MKRTTSVLLTITASVCLAASARADVIAIDENGNGIGTVGRGFLAPDPGPGGLASVLTYNLPFAGTQGDVGILEPGGGGSDLLRFNGNATVLFYSDNTGGIDALGDTPTPPGAFYPNFLLLTEVGPEGANGFIFTPVAGQPGFVPGRVTTYNFVSDGSVPEPFSVVLLATVLLLLAVVFRGRTKAAPASLP
jgi:hypothetical protein